MQIKIFLCENFLRLEKRFFRFCFPLKFISNAQIHRVFQLDFFHFSNYITILSAIGIGIADSIFLVS